MNKIKPEIFFSIILLVFGTFLIFITPIGAGFDEDTHLGRIWEMSKGVLIPNQYLSKGPFYPYAFYQLSYRQDVNLNPISWETWQAQLGTKIDWNNMINHKTRSIYFPTFYLPQAFIVGVLGRVLDMPVAIIYYCLRFSYLISFVIFTYLAIRIVPFGKWIMGLLSVSPMALIQASSISPDAINNGGCFLFIAWVLYLNSSAKKAAFSWRDWIITVIFVIMIATFKINSLPLLLLLFLIPRQKFGSKKNLIGFILITFLAVGVIYAGWNVLTSTNLNVISTGETSPSQQLIGIIKDPLHFINAMVYNLETQYGRYYKEWVGVSGYGYWDMPAPVYWITPILVLIAILVEGTENILDGKKRFWIAIVFLAIYVLTITVFYLIYNPPDSIIIPGVQGRYFIIAAPLLFYAFFPRLSHWRSGISWLQAGSILTATISLVALFLTYHVFCGASYYSTGPCYLPQYKNWSPQTSSSIQVSGTTDIQQTFRANSDNMNQLRFWVPIKPDKPQDSFVVELKDFKTNKVLANKTYLQKDITSPGWVNFLFSPINESNNQTYIIDFHPADSQNQQNIELSYSKTNEYLDGDLSINGQSNNGDLLFQYGCKIGLDKLIGTTAP